jgi:threonine dehydrogenase-like Zn-dependent dehydrogenase
VPETIASAPRLTRKGGRVVILGVLPHGASVPIEPFHLLFREIHLHFAFLNRSRRRVPQARSPRQDSGSAADLARDFAGSGRGGNRQPGRVRQGEGAGRAG